MDSFFLHITQERQNYLTMFTLINIKLLKNYNLILPDVMTSAPVLFLVCCTDPVILEPNSAHHSDDNEAPIIIIFILIILHVETQTVN